MHWSGGADMDLGELLGGEMPEKPKELVDLSGRPQPTRATIILTSGIQVEADVRYRGPMPNGDRGFRVVAEIDWDTDNVAAIEVDRWPPDVQITLWMPSEVSDERCREIGHSIDWRVAGKSQTPRLMARDDGPFDGPPSSYTKIL